MPGSKLIPANETNVDITLVITSYLTPTHTQPPPPPPKHLEHLWDILMLYKLEWLDYESDYGVRDLSKNEVSEYCQQTFDLKWTCHRQTFYTDD